MRKDFAAPQRLGDGFAVGDFFASLADGILDDAIGDDLFSDSQCRQNGHAVFEEGGEGAGELAEQVQLDHFAKDRRGQFPLIDLAPALGGGLEAFEDDDDGQRDSQHQPPIAGKHMTDVDQDLGKKRHGHVHPFKHRHEPGQHEGHEKEDDAHADRGDEGRIDERGGKFGLDLRKLLEMVGHSAQDFDQRAAGFAGPHHVDV